jgi:hypothetical protein
LTSFPPILKKELKFRQALRRRTGLLSCMANNFPPLNPCRAFR